MKQESLQKDKDVTANANILNNLNIYSIGETGTFSDFFSFIADKNKIIPFANWTDSVNFPAIYGFGLAAETHAEKFALYIGHMREVWVGTAHYGETVFTWTDLIAVKSGGVTAIASDYFTTQIHTSWRSGKILQIDFSITIEAETTGWTEYPIFSSNVSFKNYAIPFGGFFTRSYDKGIYIGGNRLVTSSAFTQADIGKTFRFYVIGLTD